MPGPQTLVEPNTAKLWEIQGYLRPELHRTFLVSGAIQVPSGYSHHAEMQPLVIPPGPSVFTFTCEASGHGVLLSQIRAPVNESFCEFPGIPKEERDKNWQFLLASSPAMMSGYEGTIKYEENSSAPSQLAPDCSDSCSVPWAPSLETLLSALQGPETACRVTGLSKDWSTACQAGFLLSKTSSGHSSPL